jgi:hypothetical protein
VGPYPTVSGETSHDPRLFQKTVRSLRMAPQRPRNQGMRRTQETFGAAPAGAAAFSTRPLGSELAARGLRAG